MDFNIYGNTLNDFEIIAGKIRLFFRFQTTEKVNVISAYFVTPYNMMV